MKWLISLDAIEEQYNKIGKLNIKIDTLLAFTYIKSYLKIKFSHDLLLQYVSTKHDNVVMTELSKQLILIKRKKKAAGLDLRRYKNGFEDAREEFKKIIKCHNFIPTLFHSL